MDSARAKLIQEANAVIVAGQALDAVGRFFTEDYRVDAGAVTGTGHAFIRKALRLTQRAFPTLAVTVEILVDDGARVAWMRTLTGRHDGTYQGFPATGRRVTWREMVTSELREGRIAREWLLSDLAEQLLRARKRPAA